MNPYEKVQEYIVKHPNVTITAAIKAVGVTAPTYYQWKRRSSLTKASTIGNSVDVAETAKPKQARRKRMEKATQLNLVQTLLNVIVELGQENERLRQ